MEYLIKAKQCDVSNRVFVLFWCGLEVWKWCDRMKQTTKCLRTTLLVLFFIPKGRLAFHRCDPSMVAEVNVEPPRLALQQLPMPWRGCRQTGLHQEGRQTRTLHHRHDGSF